MAAVFAAKVPLQARVLLTQKEALALAFPSGETVERRTAYLTEEQRSAAQARGRVKVESLVWTYYVDRSSSGVFAYFETHTVRTQSETFMAVLNSDGSVRFVEILAFAEPDEYRADARWLKQFSGRQAAAEFYLGRSLANRSGATLTSQALADGIRRVVSVHAIIHGLK